MLTKVRIFFLLQVLLIAKHCMTIRLTLKQQKGFSLDGGISGCSLPLLLQSQPGCTAIAFPINTPVGEKKTHSSTVRNTKRIHY
jgi:hypothetical protein